MGANPGTLDAMSPAVKPTYHQTSLEQARELARVDAEGHVFITDKTSGEEINLGQYSAGGGEDEALQYFSRKFDELYNRVLLLGARVATEADTAASLSGSLKALKKELDAGAWLGDTAALEGLLKEIDGGIAEIAGHEKQQNEAAVAAKLAVREEIVAEAEQISAADPASQHWKSAQARMGELFEAWQAEQKSSPRLSKSVEDPLWKRFRNARSTFERQRKAFFVRRDKEAAEVKRAKEALITEAEQLQNSTEYGPTTKAYHRLMDRWKELGRGPRKTEDAQWARFRAAQDVFFHARDEANRQVDEEYAKNLSAKEEILVKLRELMPFTTPGAVKDQYLRLTSQWDAAGKVPRGDVKRMEAAISEIQDAFREAEGSQFRRAETPQNDRQNDMVAQLEETIAGLEQQLQAAVAAGDQRAQKEAEEALKARRSWLEMLTSR